LSLLDSVQEEVERVKSAKEALPTSAPIIPIRKAITSEQRDDQERAKANPGRRRQIDIGAKVAAVKVPPPAGTSNDRKIGTFQLK